MLNISGVEIAVILIAALLLLGPQRLPEIARGLGKFLRDFRRQTDDVRTMVEREFYQMDQEIQKIGEPVPNSVPAADKPASAAPETSSATPKDPEQAILPTGAPSTEAPIADASGVTDELYDAEYHAAEAKGLISSPPEAPSEPAPVAAAEPVAVPHPPAASGLPSHDPPQEPMPRAK